MARLREDIDWEGVERDYRAGIATLRAIGERYGCTHALVQKRAARDGWERDLSAKIAAEAAALVAKQEVAKEVAKSTKVATEREIVQVNANAVAIVALAHRRDIKGLRDLAARYKDELEGYEEDLQKRASILKTLTDVQTRLVQTEREAYGMDKGDPIGADAVVQIVRRIVG